MVLFTLSKLSRRAQDGQGPESGKTGGTSPDKLKESVVNETVVAVPLVTLTADDCDPSQVEPPPRAALTDRVVEFVVPEGSRPGCTLKVPMEAGERMKVALPQHAKVGDTLRMCQRADGSWRVSQKATKFSFVMSHGTPGKKMRLQNGPHGFPLAFRVPDHAVPGDIINLQRTESKTWRVESTHRVGTDEPSYDYNDDHGLAGCYKEILNVVYAKIQSSNRLSMSSHGFVRVNVPLCGRFSEYALLGDFVAKNLLTMPGVAGGRIVATDLNDDNLLHWSMAYRWFSRHQPSIQVECYGLDFSQDCPPKADITVVIHPEVTRGAEWFRIIGSIVQSCARGGLVVFATFYRAEADTVVNMVRMYADGVADIEVIQNPWYASSESLHPPMRYIVVFRSECPAN